jgi:hypothetical protein
MNQSIPVIGMRRKIAEDAEAKRRIPHSAMSRRSASAPDLRAASTRNGLGSGPS